VTSQRRAATRRPAPQANLTRSTQMNTDAPKTQELEPSILAMALLYAALLLGANLLVGGGLA